MDLAKTLVSSSTDHWGYNSFKAFSRYVDCTGNARAMAAQSCLLTRQVRPNSNKRTRIGMPRLGAQVSVAVERYALPRK